MLRRQLIDVVCATIAAGLLAGCATPAGPGGGEKIWSTSPASADARTERFAQALVGNWRGVLEYRDFRSDRRSTLPAMLSVTPGDEYGALRFAYSYDGTLSQPTSVDVARIDAAAATLTMSTSDGKGATRYKLSGLDSFASGRSGTLVLLGASKEDAVDVESRITMKLLGETLETVRETRAKGADWAFRSRYALTRALGG